MQGCNRQHPHLALHRGCGTQRSAAGWEDCLVACATKVAWQLTAPWCAQPAHPYRTLVCPVSRPRAPAPAPFHSRPPGMPTFRSRVHGPQQCLARAAHYPGRVDCVDYRSSCLWWLYNLGLAQVQRASCAPAARQVAQLAAVSAHPPPSSLPATPSTPLCKPAVPVARPSTHHPSLPASPLCRPVRLWQGSGLQWV